ncbi:MAG: hypothetical protein ACK5QW_00135, partial [Cyanobacteriota bacterium]
RRSEQTANSAFRQRCWLRQQGRPLRLDPAPSSLLAVRYRLHRLYPCLHPGIAPDWPLRLVVGQSGGGVEAFALTATGERFLAAEIQPSDPLEPPSSPPWAGREHPDAVTLDLRLESLGFT